MQHEELIKKLARKRTVQIKDLDELLKFTLDKNNDVVFMDDFINVYVPIWFDVDKAFGLDVCTDDNGDWINLYIDWYKEEPHLEMSIDYCNNTTSDPDFSLDVELSPSQYKAIEQKFEEQYKKAYGMNIEDALKTDNLEPES